MGVLVARLSRALREVAGAEHVYLFGIGDGVAHVHLHVVARYPGAPREYYGPKVDEWPDAPHGGPDEIAALCDRLRNGWRPSTCRDEALPRPRGLNNGLIKKARRIVVRTALRSVRLRCTGKIMMAGNWNPTWPS